MKDIIKELRFKLGSKKISLTMKQARKLKEVLDELFGREIIHYLDRRWQEPSSEPEVPIGPFCTASGDSVSSSDGTMTIILAG